MIVYIAAFKTDTSKSKYRQIYEEEFCMAQESAFDKKLTQETTLDKVEGILEHFNLPPKAIQYFRANHKIIVVCLAVLLIGVVSGSLYNSYRKRIVQEGAAALAAAVDLSGQERAQKLNEVISEYSSTTSALWAKVELAHLDMKDGKYKEAGEKYKAILAAVKTDNPVYPLVQYAYAQSLEADGQNDTASTEYEKLTSIKGYEHIGYTGMSRIQEVQGNIDKAVAILNNYLLSVGDDPSFAQAKAEIDNKIALLKARK